MNRARTSATLLTKRPHYPIRFPPLMWQHNYAPLNGSLGLSAVVAAVPIFVLFLMLGVFRRPAWMSALAALVSAVLVPIGAYGLPVHLAALSILYGAAFGNFPISLIVFPAI